MASKSVVDWHAGRAGGLHGRRGGAGAERPPNIILIVADDLGWGDVGFNGRTEWSTPNLDRLAQQGTSLPSAATPRRWSAPRAGPRFLTGKYTIHSGVTPQRRRPARRGSDDRRGAQAAGLRHGPLRQVASWQAPRRGRKNTSIPWTRGSTSSSDTPTRSTPGKSSPTMLWNGRERVPVSGYIDDLITDRAVEFLGRHKDTPFFLYLPYVATHFDIAAPADEVARHRGKLPETDPSLPLNATYAAMVTRLDAQCRPADRGPRRTGSDT